MQTSTPGLFDCARTRMRLTPRGCSTMFKAAQAKAPAPWDGNHRCLGCPIGARNSGQEVPSVTVATARYLKMVCPRCARLANRMVRGRFCVSCYNRLLEVEKGANAKGTAPTRLINALHSQIFAVVEAGGPPRRVEQHEVTSTAEALFSMARQATAQLSFGWSPHADLGA